MRKLAILAALSTAAILSASSLSAQAEVRQGFYGSAGIGYGSNAISLSADGDKPAGPSQRRDVLRRRRLDAQPEVRHRRRMELCQDELLRAASDVANSFYSAAFTWFPMAKNNFFAKINLGYGGRRSAATAIGFGNGLLRAALASVSTGRLGRVASL